MGSARCFCLCWSPRQLNIDSNTKTQGQWKCTPSDISYQFKPRPQTGQHDPGLHIPTGSFMSPQHGCSQIKLPKNTSHETRSFFSHVAWEHWYWHKHSSGNTGPSKGRGGIIPSPSTAKRKRITQMLKKEEIFFFFWKVSQDKQGAGCSQPQSCSLNTNAAQNSFFSVFPYQPLRQVAGLASAPVGNIQSCPANTASCPTMSHFH